MLASYLHEEVHYKTQETPSASNIPQYWRVSPRWSQMLSPARAIDLYRLISILGRGDETRDRRQELDSNGGRENLKRCHGRLGGLVWTTWVKKDQQNLLNPARPHQRGNGGTMATERPKTSALLSDENGRADRWRTRVFTANAQKRTRCAGDLEQDDKHFQIHIRMS